MTVPLLLLPPLPLRRSSDYSGKVWGQQEAAAPVQAAHHEAEDQAQLPEPTHIAPVSHGAGRTKRPRVDTRAGFLPVAFVRKRARSRRTRPREGIRRRMIFRRATGVALAALAAVAGGADISINIGTRLSFTSTGGTQP